ncbi:MAG: crotonyl-CoA carboxylase/reductase [Acidimicrobiia bacterium]
MSVEQIRQAVLEGASGDEIASIPLPESYKAAVVRKEDVGMFEGLAHQDKDPRKSVHIENVPLPELGPDEAYIAVMASSINYNTVWTSIFEPIPTFAFLEKYGKLSDATKKHDLPYHVMGSDASGVVLRVGEAVRRWKPGDRVTVHCNVVDLQDPEGHEDSMLDPNQKIWGFETNFGGLAEIALVKANALMPKPKHLTWEEAASPGLVNSTTYRMLVGENAARMRQGQVVLIWGAAGGLGGFACQYVLNGGGFPVAIVSSPKKAEILRSMGVEWIIDRKAEGFRFWDEEGNPNVSEFRRLGKAIRDLTGGEDPDIVFEHTGRDTFAASVFLAKRGGTVVTCASTSGYMHIYDNRYLWMNLKRIIGSHFANYNEAWEANRLVALGKIHPILSKTYTLDETGQAAYEVHHNLHVGKLGILCMAPQTGLGIDDPELRQKVGEESLNRFKGK